jgi:hypothetical protein
VLRKHPDFIQELRTARFWLVFLIIVIVNVWLGHERPVEVASHATWDAVEVSLANRSSRSRGVHIIEITKTDYEELFGSTSPLEPDALAKLIATALTQHPHKLVVDIDTSASKFLDLPRRVAFFLHCLNGCAADAMTKYLPYRDAQARQGDLPALEPHAFVLEAKLREAIRQINDTVVWARGASPPKPEGANFALEPVLGKQTVDDGVCAGVVMLQADDDGRLRRLRRFFPTGRDSDPSLAFLARPDVVSRACDATRGDRDSEEVRLQFAPYLRQLSTTSAGEFLHKPFSLRGQTVFLGGNYSPADWFYMVDGREHTGVEALSAGALALSANAVVNEWNGWYTALALEFFLGLVVSAVYHTFKPILAFAIVLIVIVGGSELAVAGSMAIGMIVNIVALCLAVGIDQSVHLLELAADEDTAGALHVDRAVVDTLTVTVQHLEQGRRK